MSLDREQVKKDAETEIQFGGPPYDPLASHCLALLAELEQAERLAGDMEMSRDIHAACIDSFEVLLYGSSDGRSRDTMEARLAKVPALVEALKAALELRQEAFEATPVRDDTRDFALQLLGARIRKALTEYEQQQPATSDARPTTRHEAKPERN